MSISKLSNYAPDVYKCLNGLLKVYKPPQISSKEHVIMLKDKISDLLNHLEPRPLENQLKFDEATNELITEPDLADHPLIVGPRYLPWELKMICATPGLGYTSSGLNVIAFGSANRYFGRKFLFSRMVNVYQITGRFGYITSNFFYHGKIQDKSTYHHIRSGMMDRVLAKIESTQHERLFDSAKVDISSQEAYELAKAWPSKPPSMADWPVIYRLRCIHLKPPEFKLEVTVINENEGFLAQLCHEVGLMLKSGAYVESLRRVKMGIFSVDEAIIDSDWNLQSIINNISLHTHRYKEVHDMFRQMRQAGAVKQRYDDENLQNAPLAREY